MTRSGLDDKALFGGAEDSAETQDAGSAAPGEEAAATVASFAATVVLPLSLPAATPATPTELALANVFAAPLSTELVQVVAAEGPAVVAADASGFNSAPTFVVTDATGSVGKLMQPVGTGDDAAMAVAVQADGKILLAGRAQGAADADVAVVRLLADGSLDPDFGNGGRVILPVGDGADGAYAMTVQADGRIVLFGDATVSGQTEHAVVRLNADGSLDETFGNAGIVLTAVGNSTDYSAGLAVQTNGGILLAGSTWNGSNFDLAVTRLTANGNLDSTFGTSGHYVLDVAAGDDNASAIALQADGKVLIAGTTFNGTTFDLLVMRLLANGSLDTSFNGTGRLVLSIGSADDFAGSLLVQTDGKIVLGGTTQGTNGYDAVLVRLTTSGALDTTFNATGKLTIDVGGSDDFGYGLAQQSDGKLLLVGQSNGTGGATDVGIIRVTTAGTLDTTFNSTGKAVIGVGDADDAGYGVALTSDGHVLVAGASQGAADADFGLLKLNSNGSVDSSFVPTTLSTLGGTVAHVEDGEAVSLDLHVAVHDVELAALDSGAGNYAGASLVLVRQGGASSDDEFGATGSLSFADGMAWLDGVAIASLTQDGGQLVLAFNDAATQARVNAALSSLTYRNTSNAPPASMTVAWTFSDGNTGVQGSGGALAATGGVQVEITAVNDAPQVTALTDRSYVDDGQSLFSIDLDEAFTDPDGVPLSSITLTSSTELPTWLSYDAGTHVLSGIAPTGTTSGWSFNVTGTDAAGVSASGNFSLSLANLNLAGSDAADTLTGHSGQDTLDGGAGADTMAGGAGDDTYVVDDAGDVVVEAAGQGNDTVLASANFVLTGGAEIETARLTGSANQLTGNELDNTLIGGALADTLTGGDGDDSLDGGVGADSLYGGTGNDRYTIDHPGDAVVENAGEGTDTVTTSLSHQLEANVENLTLAGGAGSISGTGNELANLITGNEGANAIDGGAGMDTLVGAAGDDSYTVDHAGDAVVENTGEGSDTVTTSLNHQLEANVENLTLAAGAGSISGTGNELDNVITGNEGANVIDGGAGNDTLSGGAGDDTYHVDSATDVVTESPDQGMDTVYASVSYTLAEGVENLTLVDEVDLSTAGSDTFAFGTAPAAGTNGVVIDDFSANGLVTLDNDVFTAQGTAGAMATEAIPNGAGMAGALYYDADGFSTVTSMQFATLTTQPVLTAANFVVTE